MQFFKDKVVAITGGGSGIGESVAKEFCNEAASVSIFGRDSHKLTKVQKQLKNSLAIVGDVRNINDLDRLYENISERFGKIDVLVANAGVASRCSIDDVDEEYFDEVVDINFKGLFFTVQRALPFLSDNASVVLISSMACHAGWPAHSVYSSTKAAVSMLAKNFSADLIHKGIRVNAISPGFTDSGMFEQDFVNEYKERIPTKQFVQPDEIAKAVVFLSSPKASSIVGIDLVIDGGFTSIIKE